MRKIIFKLLCRVAKISFNIGYYSLVFGAKLMGQTVLYRMDEYKDGFACHVLWVFKQVDK